MEGQSSHDRLEDVFQEEILRAFVRMVDFKMFARSENGLCLADSDVQHIIESNLYTVVDQKMALLNRWREKNGNEATAKKIRSLATRFNRIQMNPDERLEDVFQEIIKDFSRMDDFRMFVRSKNGLRLDESVIQPIIENNPDSVTDQKMAFLNKWKEINGEEATAQKIRSLSTGFTRGINPAERLEDVFQEILKAFMRMDDFKMFVRSKNGLCLDESDIQPIIENNRGSVTDQKMALLNKWKEIKGEEATVRKVRSLVTGYKKDINPDDYISLHKDMFGIFRKEPLSKYGHVFLGEQLSDLVERCLRAIKLVRYDEGNLRETQILTKLGMHENIVSTIHAGSYYAGPIKYIFIVMELFFKTNLRDIFGKRTLDGRTAMNFAIKIMKALAFIHKHKIVHRDLKPENILVSDDLKNLKLTDFGISKAIKDGYQTEQTNANTGTVGYRARETYDENEKISAKADIFSAGVTLAETFSNGKHPYGDDPHLLSSNIIKKIEPDLSQVFVPKKPQTQKLLGWMLQPKPEDRPTAEEVQNDLKQLEKTQDFAQAGESQSGQPSTSSELKNIVTWEDRLEDVFQEEILRAFVRMDDFKMFVRSKNGLCLDESVIQPIIENNFDSVIDQKMALFKKWKEIKGEEATARKIRDLVTGYKRGINPYAYISLRKNMFGIFKREPLSKRGHVFLGEQLSDLVGRRLRAIKLVPYNEEKLRKAQILIRLGAHENIVSTIHADTYHASPFTYIFIVMELYFKTTLRDIFKKQKLDEHTAMDFANKIIKALVFIHGYNILHRDLKSENILVSDDLKQLKLSSFGISKIIMDVYTTRVNIWNPETEGYRAPETHDDEMRISAKADIFSAGVTLAEIFSNGKHPYGDNPHLLNSNIRNKKKPDLTQVFVPKKPQTQKLLRWMLQPEPEDRPTAEEVQNYLKRLGNTKVVNEQSAADKRQATSSSKLKAKKSNDFAQADESQSDQPSTSSESKHNLQKGLGPARKEALKKIF